MSITIKAKIIKRPSFAVDIILPFYGAYEHVYLACKSIWKNTKTIPYHIYLVDDCSPNNTFLGAFKETPHLTCVRTEKHSGFGAALYEGFKAAYENDKRKPSSWVVFMHSDCEIQNANWLINLFASFENLISQEVVMVSARSNNSGNNFMEARRGEVFQDVLIPEGSFMPLYCSLCQRNLFAKIGSFIQPYPYAMYEDEELSYRIRAYGYRQGISGKSWIKHAGGVTIDFLCRQGQNYSTIMENNREKCIQDMLRIKAITGGK